MNPVLIDLPVPITTKRLILRPPMAGDGAELSCAVRESYPELRPWIFWARPDMTADESEDSVRRAMAAWILREDLRLAIFERSTGLLIGGTGLHRPNWQSRRFEIGYWARTSATGNGYISEAISALTQYAFKVIKSNRVEIRIDKLNERSKKIPTRLGFELEACLRRESLNQSTNDLRDILVYSRLDANHLPEVEASWPS